jgi:hypothetical protein
MARPYKGNWTPARDLEPGDIYRLGGVKRTKEKVDQAIASGNNRALEIYLKYYVHLCNKEADNKL